MIEALSDALSKCRWLCFIILFAFSVESIANHAFVADALSDYKDSGKIIALINSILTGVVLLTVFVFIWKKIKMYNEEESKLTSNLSILELADYRIGVEWAILFKWAFVLLECNINGTELLKCVFSGFHTFYFWLIIAVLVRILIPILKKKMNLNN